MPLPISARVTHVTKSLDFQKNAIEDLIFLRDSFIYCVGVINEDEATVELVSE